MALINRNNRTYVAQSTLSYLVTHVMGVAERHGDNPAVNAAVVPAVQAGEAFTAKVAARRNAVLRRARVKQESLGRSGHTEDVLRTWVPILAGPLSFDPGVFTPASSRPADVILTGSNLLAFVDAQGDVTLPPNLVAAVAELRSTFAAAQAKSSEARTALIDVQARSQEVRDAAAAFHGALVVLRRVLSNVLGRSHLDYQALRYARVSADDETTEIVDDTAELETADEAAPAATERESGEFAAVKAEAS